MFYLTMSFGMGYVGFLFLRGYQGTQKLSEFKDIEDFYLKMEKKEKIVTENEIRLMGERNKVDNIPVSDEETGYMWGFLILSGCLYLLIIINCYYYVLFLWKALVNLTESKYIIQLIIH